ncbi:MAG: radical SAM family heme chaperone HemW [Spirochaetaceae bacterium]|jgi:oxygen-independent coproporphyrinogen-3 oxidase|nr:radical SAM family heme chaperone HemW [Spirochaetaceae bacterium]
MSGFAGGAREGAGSCLWVKASLYIHIPFCASKCAYCDFFSVPTSVPTNAASTIIDEYLEALYRDIESQLIFFKIDCVPSIYIGGGTPSLLGGKRIAALLSFLNFAKKTDGGTCELTVEANSESLSEDFIQGCVEGGVSRLSIGVQSLNDASRRAVARRGSSRRIIENIKFLQNKPAALDISFDILSGLPYQHKEILLHDIETLLAFNPAHISLYDLMIEGGGLSGAMLEKLPAGEVKEKMWIAGRDFLESAGYAQYEVSNFAREGKRARHNIRYWMMENWIGCGPSASGTIIDDERGTAIRYTTRHNIFYAPPPLRQTIEHIDRETLLKETLMMGYRYIDGPDEALFKKRFSCTLESVIPKTIAAWRATNFYSETKNTLTPKGLLFLNQFLLDCFDELSRGECGTSSRCR